MGPEFEAGERISNGEDHWAWREGFDPSGRRGRRSRGPGRRPGRGRGGWDRGYGNRVARGDVRASILALLAEQPMHGYQIINELDERTGGVWKPSPGSVYPTLQMLEDEGLLRAEPDNGRKVFHLTDAGREVAESGEPEPWASMADDRRQVGSRRIAEGLFAAYKQVSQTGTPDQVERARAVMNDARKALYGILAEDVEGS